MPNPIDAMPVLFRVAGSNFSPIGEALKSLKGRDSLMQNHLLNLTTIRKKAGSNVYYVSKISVDSKEIDFTQKDLEYMICSVLSLRKRTLEYLKNIKML